MEDDRRSPRGPLRAFRDRYVGFYGGLSYDLAPGAVGVDVDCLQAAPELPGRRVLVSSDRHRPVTLGQRPAFDVVPITTSMRDARRAGASGGIVFSTFDLDTPHAGPLLRELGLGDTIFLNSAIERLREDFIRRPFGADAA